GQVVAFVVGDKYEKAPRSWSGASAAVAADHYATHRQRPKSRIWQVSVTGGDARPLTQSPGTDNNPRWSPDGQTLAFLSDRGPEKLQTWDYDWSPDGSQFVALVGDEPFATRWFYARYVTFPSGGGAARTIYATDRQLAGARWSPDGRWVAFIRGLYSDRGSIG